MPNANQTRNYNPEQIKLLLEELTNFHENLFDKEFTPECFTNVISLAAATEADELTDVNIWSLPKLVKELLMVNTHLVRINKIITNNLNA